MTVELIREAHESRLHVGSIVAEFSDAEHRSTGNMGMVKRHHCVAPSSHTVVAASILFLSPVGHESSGQSSRLGGSLHSAQAVKISSCVQQHLT